VSILSVDDNRNPSYRPVLLSGKSSNQQSIEQIWMPGVHADVGGNSDSVFLSDVALLTMIERVKTYCPELIWDEGYIAHRREELGKKVEVRISDERFDWKRKLLWRAQVQWLLRRARASHASSTRSSTASLIVWMDKISGFGLSGKRTRHLMCLGTWFGFLAATTSCSAQGANALLQKPNGDSSEAGTKRSRRPPVRNQSGRTSAPISPQAVQTILGHKDRTGISSGSPSAFMTAL
jgi:hypothetical protein